jgi:hypothetical protein
MLSGGAGDLAVNHTTLHKKSDGPKKAPWSP